MSMALTTVAYVNAYGFPLLFINVAPCYSGDAQGSARMHGRGARVPRAGRAQPRAQIRLHVLSARPLVPPGFLFARSALGGAIVDTRAWGT